MNMSHLFGFATVVDENLNAKKLEMARDRFRKIVVVYVMEVISYAVT